MNRPYLYDVAAAMNATPPADAPQATAPLGPNPSPSSQGLWALVDLPRAVQNATQAASGGPPVKPAPTASLIDAPSPAPGPWGLNDLLNAGPGAPAASENAPAKSRPAVSLADPIPPARGPWTAQDLVNAGPGEPLGKSQPNTPAPQQAPSAPQPAQDEPVLQPPISLAQPGGVIPAHEASRLGPSQWAALNTANAAQEEAIKGIAERSGQQAVADEAVYAQQAAEARAREEAAQRVAIARENELRALASDFDRQARELSKEKLDPGRLWASKSTPQKIAAYISIALGGFVSGATGGPNTAMQMLNEQIDRDIEAQKLAISLKRDRLNSSHTAYGMALQRYQNDDAARAFARVAAMDAVAAEIARQQAQNKGTEVANRAQAALAELAQQRAAQIQQGIAFIPSQVIQPKYHVANRLGTYTLNEIDANQIAPEEARGHQLQLEWLKRSGELQKEQIKQETDDAKYIAQALAKENIPQTIAAAEAARKAILGTPKNYTEQVAEKLYKFIPVSDEVLRKFDFGSDAVAREQAWTTFKNYAMRALYGSNVTANEAERAKTAFEGANDDKSRLRAIQLTQEALQASERNIRKGASTKGNALYQSREPETGGSKPLSEVIPPFKPTGR